MHIYGAMPYSEWTKISVFVIKGKRTNRTPTMPRLVCGTANELYATWHAHTYSPPWPYERPCNAETTVTSSSRDFRSPTHVTTSLPVESVTLESLHSATEPSLPCTALCRSKTYTDAPATRRSVSCTSKRSSQAYIC